MTTETIPDNVGAWLDALPDRVSRQMHRTYAVIGGVNRAIDNGWTPEALAAECIRHLGTADNVGAVVLKRLRKAAETGPPEPGAKFTTFTRPKCEQCNPNRWIEDVDGYPVRRCDCAS